MKKIEIIFETIYLNRLLDLFSEKGILGYTLIRDIEGKGSTGMKSSDQIGDIFRSNYIFTICEEEKLDSIIEGIRDFIKRYGGKCMVTDVLLITPTVTDQNLKNE